MSLLDDRILFTSLVVKLLSIAEAKTWSYGKVTIAVDEWTVRSKRKYRDLLTGETRTGIDVVHTPKGFHPLGLAVDLLVYIDGKYVTDGNHPIWRELDLMAHQLNPSLNFGDEFNDSNHLSLGEVTESS